METRTSDTGPAVVPHQVLSVVSHELRGPLGVARGYLRMLAQTAGLDDRTGKLVGDASRAADRLADLLDEVSEYARWVRGEQALVRAPTSLRDILVAAAGKVSSPGAFEVRLETDALVDVTAPVDRARLTTAWAALMAATARAQVEDATIVLNLRPIDTGHGVLRIVPHHLLDAATDERPPALERAGAGLSIALADLIVRRHGGHLVERWVGEVWAGYVCLL